MSCVSRPQNTLQRSWCACLRRASLQRYRRNRGQSRQDQEGHSYKPTGCYARPGVGWKSLRYQYWRQNNPASLFRSEPRGWLAELRQWERQRLLQRVPIGSITEPFGEQLNEETHFRREVSMAWIQCAHGDVVWRVIRKNGYELALLKCFASDECG